MAYSVDINLISEYNTHKSKINPKTTALIVIEMQNVFLRDMEIISEGQIENIKNIISALSKHGSKIIFVRHNDSAESSKSMIEWWGGDKIEKGSEGWEIIDAFNAIGKTIIDKNQYSAFHKTDLDKILKENNIGDVVIMGVMTNCCCETTARDAFMYGYRVFFVNDATSTINEELHLASLKNISFGFAYVQNTQDIICDINGANK